MDIAPYVSKLRERFKVLEAELSDPELYSDRENAQNVTREHAQIKETLSSVDHFDVLKEQMSEAKKIVSSESDEEMKAMAEEELLTLEKDLEGASEKVFLGLLPPEETDSRNTIIEIRAGTGGNEAALFAADLYRMYLRYAEIVGWKCDMMDASPSDLGGYKEVIFQMNGTDVFKKMRFESGVHRVQRVPATEAQGRIHTSAATVAVLPEAKEVDLVLKPEEVRIEVCRSGGPGGQGVNTTDSSVQVLHIPTGMIVKCQDGRSQIKNREKALGVLRSRLLQKKRDEEAQKYSQQRRKQIGSGDRNEKIRTYNYPQNRITDHRINFSSYNLTEFMEGAIEEMLGKLLFHNMESRLQDAV